MPDRSRPALVVAGASFWNLSIHRSGLVRALERIGYSVVVVAPAGPGEDTLRDMGIATEVVDMQPTGTSPVADLALYRRYYALLARVRPAAFLSFNVKPNVYGSLAANRLGIPTINNISGLGRVFTSRSLLTRLVEHLYRMAFRRACVVFFENRDDSALFLERRIVRKEQVVNLPGAGLDLDQFAPVPLDQGRSGSREFTFLFAARLLWDKGVQQFVDAAQKVRESHPNTRFQILGIIDPPSRAAVPRETLDEWHRQGVIEFLGEASDVRPMIAGADCVVLPSYYREGVPRILMEAAAMAKPAITTEMPGCRDAVEHGETGFLVAPRSAEALVDAMEHMLRLDTEARAEMGRKARLKMERQFNQEVIHEFYRQALMRCVPAAARPQQD